MIDDWLWLGRDFGDGRDPGARARTFVKIADEQTVADAFRLGNGERQWLTSAQAEDQRSAWFAQQPGRDFGDPPFQIRILPLGDWSLVLEDDQILRAIVPKLAIPEGTHWLTAEFTLTTQLSMFWRSGNPAEPLSYYGAVLFDDEGYLRDVADRIGFDNDTDSNDAFGRENSRLLAAVAEEQGIPVVDPAVLRGPLLTISGG